MPRNIIANSEMVYHNQTGLQEVVYHNAEKRMGVVYHNRNL